MNFDIFCCLNLNVWASRCERGVAGADQLEFWSEEFLFADDMKVVVNGKRQIEKVSIGCQKECPHFWRLESIWKRTLEGNQNWFQ